LLVRRAGSTASIPERTGASKGLRLVTAYGIAAMLGTTADIVRGLPDGAALNSLAGGFALWASVSEGRATRAESSRDLLLLSAAAALGAASFIVLAPLLQHLGHTGPELTLATGAFLVGYLRRFGLTGTGVGSQVGRLDAKKVGALFQVSVPAIAKAAGITRQALDENPDSEKAQPVLKLFERVARIRSVSQFAEASQLRKWFRQPLPIFGNHSAEDLFKAGKLDVAAAKVDQLLTGDFGG